MPSDLSAEQPGHLTMFTDDYDAVVAQLRAAQGDEVVRLGGLRVHFAPAELGGAIARERAYWPDDQASQARRPDYHADRGHLNAVAYGVRFGDHTVEFLGSASGGDHDLVGGFLAGHGPGIFSTTYLVRDFSAARAALAAQDIAFTQWGRHSLLLRPESAPGARIELTDEG